MEFRLDEINIFVTDRARSLAFYRDVLGFRLISEEKGACHLEGAGHRFLLLPYAEPNDARPVYGSIPSVSFDLLTPDIQAAYRHFKDKGVKFEKDLDSTGDHFFVCDPDGNVIEILEG